MLRNGSAFDIRALRTPACCGTCADRRRDKVGHAPMQRAVFSQGIPDAVQKTGGDDGGKCDQDSGDQVTQHLAGKMAERPRKAVVRVAPDLPRAGRRPRKHRGQVAFRLFRRRSRRR